MADTSHVDGGGNRRPGEPGNRINENMANQYSGRPATEAERLSEIIAQKDLEIKAGQSNMDYFVGILTRRYEIEADPFICRLLIISGVDVWAIDVARGIETVYATNENQEQLEKMIRERPA
jgi:hypothetical protein